MICEMLFAHSVLIEFLRFLELNSLHSSCVRLPAAKSVGIIKFCNRVLFSVDQFSLHNFSPSYFAVWALSLKSLPYWAVKLQGQQSSL